MSNAFSGSFVLLYSKKIQRNVSVVKTPRKSMHAIEENTVCKLILGKLKISSVMHNDFCFKHKL